jgi:hypothetical protein
LIAPELAAAAPPRYNPPGLEHHYRCDALRARAAKKLGITADKLVIPFVDNKECIAME